MTIPDETLAHWQELADAATPGEWEATIYDHGHSATDSECGVVTSDVGDIVCELRSIDRLSINERYRDEGVSDAKFIAAARTAVPALLAEVARLRAMLPDPATHTHDGTRRDRAIPVRHGYRDVGI